MSNDLTEKSENVPAWMKAKSTGASFGNVRPEDIRPPEVKLLQATSPECAEQPGARAGEFWLTGQNMNLGPEIIGTPIIRKMTYVLWNPTKSLDTKAPMAVASDGIHWDVPNQKFEVFFPNNRTPYIWETKRTVVESGLHLFGSSQRDNPRSTPAAAATYQILWAFRLPDGRPQLGIITNSRTALKPIKELFGMIDGRKPLDFYFLRFRICAVRVSMRPGEYFFSYKYFAAGLVEDEVEGDQYKALHDQFKKAGFSSDIADEVVAGTVRPPVQTYERDASLDGDDIQY